MSKDGPDRRPVSPVRGGDRLIGRPKRRTGWRSQPMATIPGEPAATTTGAREALAEIPAHARTLHGEAGASGATLGSGERREEVFDRREQYWFDILVKIVETLGGNTQLLHEHKEAFRSRLPDLSEGQGSIIQAIARFPEVVEIFDPERHANDKEGWKEIHKVTNIHGISKSGPTELLRLRIEFRQPSIPSAKDPEQLSKEEVEFRTRIRKVAQGLIKMCIPEEHNFTLSNLQISELSDKLKKLGVKASTRGSLMGKVLKLLAEGYPSQEIWGLGLIIIGKNHINIPPDKGFVRIGETGGQHVFIKPSALVLKDVKLASRAVPMDRIEALVAAANKQQPVSVPGNERAVIRTLDPDEPMEAPDDEEEPTPEPADPEDSGLLKRFFGKKRRKK